MRYIYICIQHNMFKIRLYMYENISDDKVIKKNNNMQN